MNAQQTIIPPTHKGQTPMQAAPIYGSVLRRLIAMAIDNLILNIALAAFFLFFVLLFTLPGALLLGPFLAFILMPGGSAFCVVAYWLYFATQESGPRGATLGKRLLGLRVTTEQGGPLSFRQASVRFFCKILSAMPMMLGFVMAFFTKRTQALHDLIAETLVIRV